MFARQLAFWQSVNIAIAAPCATFAGLLFVALSLHVRTMQDPKSRHRPRLPASLFVLVPELTSTVLCILLAGMGAFGVLRVAKTRCDTYRDQVAIKHRSDTSTCLYLSLPALPFSSPRNAWFILVHEPS